MKVKTLPPSEIFDVLHAAEAAGVILPESIDKWWEKETWVVLSKNRKTP